MTELEKLEMEHRVHQQKLKSSASRDRPGECERAKERGKGRTGRQGVEGARDASRGVLRDATDTIFTDLNSHASPTLDRVQHVSNR